MAMADFRRGPRGGPGEGEKLPRSTAARSRLSSYLSSTLLILVLGLVGLFLFAVSPSLAMPSDLARLLIDCYLGDDGRRTCDVYFPPNDRVRREFTRNEGDDSEIRFDVYMCQRFEESVYLGEEGCPAQQYLFDTMKSVQAVLEERHGSVSGLRDRDCGADWEGFPRGLQPESNVWPKQKPDGSDLNAARRYNVHVFQCVEGPPVRCSLVFPSADVHKTPYERTNDKGETMMVTLVWNGAFNQRRGGGTPAEVLIDRVLAHVDWLWNTDQLQHGIHPSYIYLPEGIQSFDYGRQLDFDFGRLYRVGLSFFCESTPKGRRCDVDLAPYRRVHEEMKLDEGTPGEMLFNVWMGGEAAMYLKGGEEEQTLVRGALNHLMVKIRDDLTAGYGSLEELTEEVRGSGWFDWPEPLHSDLGEHSSDIPDPRGGPEHTARLGQYVYHCRPGPPVMCFLTVPLTSRVQKNMVRNQDTEDQVSFRLFFDKAFNDLLGDGALFGRGQLLLEHVMDTILYEWRFTESSVESTHYGDDLELRIRDLQQGLQGVVYTPLPDSIRPEELGKAIVIEDVEGEGTVIQ